MLKKILKISGIILLVLIIAALALPMIFKDKITNIAKTEINKNLNATVDFKDVNLSLFRHFPRLAVGLEDLKVTGQDDFAKDTLIAAERIDVPLT